MLLLCEVCSFPSFPLSPSPYACYHYGSPPGQAFSSLLSVGRLQPESPHFEEHLQPCLESGCRRWNWLNQSLRLHRGQVVWNYGVITLHSWGQQVVLPFGNTAMFQLESWECLRECWGGLVCVSVCWYPQFPYPGTPGQETSCKGQLILRYWAPEFAGSHSPLQRYVG